MITWSIILCSHMWHYILSRTWRNLHSDIATGRNQKFEELLKLGGVQKIVIFRRRLPYEGEGWRGVIYIPLHTMWKAWVLEEMVFLDPDWNLSSILFSFENVCVWLSTTFSMILDIKGSNEIGWWFLGSFSFLNSGFNLAIVILIW